MVFGQRRFPGAKSLGSSLALAAFLSVVAGSGAARAEGNRFLPYWAAPYPANFAYDRRPPAPNECIVWMTVDTFFGPRRERVNVCGGVVVERY